MKIKFSAIIGIDEVLKAVEQNGYALQCVLDIDLFVKIATELNIEIEI